MEDTYRFLRRVEHRLQIMFDRQTHQMPRDLEEQRILAVRMGYPPASAWEDRTGPAQRFLNDYRAKTDLNRRILNHLLHDAFRDDTGATADPAVDLVLDPDPTAEQIASVLGHYPFRDRQTAYQNLLALAREDIPFLSQARCRHFLAAIAPRLLQAVSRAPDPDMALTNLEKVSASLGAKAILWELFSFNPPTLRLYVELCATSQFLSEILINNPGMIDDLMDSLVVDRAAAGAGDQGRAGRAVQGGRRPGADPPELPEQGMGPDRHPRHPRPRADPRRDPRAGRRGRGGRRARSPATSGDAAPPRHGVPRRAATASRARWAIVGLGKLGGRELNYHSDLDLIFVLEDDGRDRRRPAARSRTSSSSPRSSAASSRPWAAAPLGHAALRRRHPAPAARRLRPAGRDARRLPRLLPTTAPGLGTPGPDPRPRDLLDRRVRPGRDRRRSARPSPRRSDPPELAREVVDDAPEARRALTRATT